jgi:hypothetical protein
MLRNTLGPLRPIASRLARRAIATNAKDLGIDKLGISYSGTARRAPQMPCMHAHTPMSCIRPSIAVAALKSERPSQTWLRPRPHLATA